MGRNWPGCLPSGLSIAVDGSESTGTPWVSVATDQSVLPNGLLTLMNVTLPDEGGEHSVPFNALTLPQDTGGAIKRNRVDLFCGNGETATHTASYLDNRGAVFLLLPR